MAYGTRFYFTAEAENGNEIEILVKQRDYQGEITQRAFGGHPVLRMDENGNIRGTSLEFPAECLVADEFADLYTSDPRLFLVLLSINTSDVWSGFITPELYAAPWVDPPYDVTVTATDGLGELKRAVFEGEGKVSLLSLIEGILANTGLDFPIYTLSTLQTDLSTSADTMLSTTYVNLDHMAGESMYDVLQSVLGSLHMTVRQDRERWLLIRETDVADLTSGGSVGGAYQIKPFGSMLSESVWPVGRMESEILPARRGFVVRCPNKPIAELLDDPDMEAGSWSGTATHITGDNPCYEIAAGQNVSQVVPLPSKPSSGRDLDLRIVLSARQVDANASHDIRLKVSAYGKRVNASTYTTYYLTRGTSLSGEEVVGWSDTAGYVSFPLSEAKYQSFEDAQNVEIVIPLYKVGLESVTTFTVEVASDDNTVYLYGAHLSPVNDFDGVETTVRISNDARGNADDVDACLADSMTYNMGLQFQANALIGAHGGSESLVTDLESLSVSACRLGEFLAKDYALSLALPRLILKGKLHMPFGVSLPVFWSTDGLVFIIQEWSYDLLECEMEVNLISLPAAAISVESVTTRKWVDEKSSGGSSSGSGGSGGGGGGGGNFLPLTGGTMTGVEKMVVGPQTNTSGALLRFIKIVNDQEVNVGSVTGNTSDLMGMYSRGDIVLRPGDGSGFSTNKGIRISQTDVTFNGVSILGGGGSGGNIFYGTCTTAISASTKIVACPTFTSADLQDGTVINVLFENRNSVNGIYMNVNSTGAQQVAMGAYPYYRWEAGTIVTFVYRDQQWALVDQIASPQIFGSTRLLATFGSLNTYGDSYTGYGISARLGWWLFRKSLAAPRIKVFRGYDASKQLSESLITDHIMDDVSNGLNGCFVLMMYSKRRRRRVNSKQAGYVQAKIKEGWGEARGALATNAPVAWTMRIVDLDWLRENILRLYVRDANGSQITTVSAFRTANYPVFGRPSTQTAKRAGYKNNRLFGVAFRIDNPAYVAPQRETETTRVDKNRNPRYFYSEVAAFRVWINVDVEGYNSMGFQVAPYKDGGR